VTEPPLSRIVRYRPAGPILKTFHNSEAFVRLIMGPVGSGKSTACVMELLRRAGEQRKGPDGKRHTRFAIIRNTYGQLKTTAIKTFQQWCPPQYGKFVATPPITQHLVTDELDAEFIFLALDKPEDVDKLLSLELTGAWINEAREVPKGILDVLTTRVKRWPPKRDGGGSWYGIICDTNPPNNRHWWYQMAENEWEDPTTGRKGPPEGWEFFRQPGGLSPLAENLENLEADYYEGIAAGKDPDWLRVYVHGDYGFLREGKPVFSSFRDGVHVAKSALKPVEGLPLSIGADFGLTPAAIVGQRLPDGRWLILDEMVMDDIGITRFAEALAGYMAQHYGGHPLGTCWGDPAGAYRDQQGKTALDLMTKYTGWKWRPAPCGNNDLAIRLEVVRAALGRLIDGQPGFLVSPKCGVLREAMNGRYHYRKLRTAETEAEYREEPHKNSYSHPADALQYLLLGGGEAQVIRLIGQGRGGGGERQRFAVSEWNELDGPPETRPGAPPPGPRSRRPRERQRFAL